MKLEITMEFGSYIQRQVNEKMLVRIIAALKSQIESNHKKNKMSVKYNGQKLNI